MNGLWFNQQAFIEAAKEKGDIIKICTKKTQKTTNSDIGLVVKPTWECREIAAYHLIEKLSSVGSDGKPVKDEVSVVYVLEQNFDPNTVDNNTRFSVNDKIYQVELIDFLKQRTGVAVYYKYKLENTQKSENI